MGCAFNSVSTVFRAWSEIAGLQLREAFGDGCGRLAGIEPVSGLKVGLPFFELAHLNVENAARDIERRGFRQLREAGINHFDAHLK